MSTIHQFRELVDEKWLDTLVDLMARELGGSFSEGSITVRVDTPKCKGRMPIIRYLDELYEVFTSLGYVDKVDKDGCECSMPESISHQAYELGVPYLNHRAKEMYEKLKDEGFYELSRNLGDLEISEVAEH
tara:strand:- start:172 stop:564 length:393 start_codon:yes stop_codon:yes gene_type:complete